MESLSNNLDGKIAGAEIELRNLYKKFGNILVINDISINISAGEFLTFLGPSGSGKTTTLNLLAGFIFPTSGEILINGEEMGTKPPYKRDMGMVFQNYALFPHMTVAENIAFPLKRRKLDKQEINRKVEEALALIKLSRYENRKVNELSGGQQQRVALARAIVYQPSVLLMDEPLGSLDKKLRENMQYEIKKIQEYFKITAVYVTHDQEEALTMSDRIAVMNEGRIEQIGDPRELYERPVNSFIANFVGETNFLEGEIIDREGDTSIFLTKSENKLKVELPTDTRIGDKLTIAIRPEKFFFTKDAQPALSTMSGVIQEVIYLGEITKYIIRITETKQIILKQMNRFGVDNYKKESVVSFAFNPRDAKKVLAK